jgi:hypothetical protein
VHCWSQVRDLLQMSIGQSVELGGPRRRERDAHQALAGPIRVALDQPILDGAVHEPHGAVVAQDEVVGELADRRADRAGMALDREQQLVLGRRQPCGICLIVAPA